MEPNKIAKKLNIFLYHTHYIKKPSIEKQFLEFQCDIWRKCQPAFYWDIEISYKEKILPFLKNCNIEKNEQTGVPCGRKLILCYDDDAIPGTRKVWMRSIKQ